MQDSLPAEKVFDTGGYLATFRHRAKMTIGQRFNKGSQEDQISRMTTIMGGSANGIFPHDQDSHREGEGQPKSLLWTTAEFGQQGCDGDLCTPYSPAMVNHLHHHLCYPLPGHPWGWWHTVFTPHHIKNPMSLTDFVFLGVQWLGSFQLLNPALPYYGKLTCSLPVNANVHLHSD